MCVNAKGIRTKERRLSYSRFHRPKPESVANYSDSLRYQMSDRIVFLSLCLNDQRTADRLALSVPISLGVGVEGGGGISRLCHRQLSRGARVQALRIPLVQRRASSRAGSRASASAKSR